MRAGACTQNDEVPAEGQVRQMLDAGCATGLTRMAEDAAPVARWEFWSVATMLISTHGEDAERKAALSLAEAREAGRAGDVVAWRAIIDKLAEIRSGSDR